VRVAVGRPDAPCHIVFNLLEMGLEKPNIFDRSRYPCGRGLAYQVAIRDANRETRLDG
jgi:hypothetical protein